MYTRVPIEEYLAVKMGNNGFTGDDGRTRKKEKWNIVVVTNVVVVTILTSLMMNNKSLVNFSDLYNNSYLFIY